MADYIPDRKDSQRLIRVMLKKASIRVRIAMNLSHQMCLNPWVHNIAEKLIIDNLTMMGNKFITLKTG